MSLENALKAYDLVETNPTSSDLVQSADDHLRMIKAILKKGYLGEFGNLTAIKAIVAEDNSFFSYNKTLYVIVSGFVAEDSLPNMIKLTSGKTAFRFASGAIGKQTLFPTASSQKRFPRTEKVTISGSVFDSTAASAAFGGTPVAGDFVLMFGTKFSEARIFTTTWATVDNSFFGYQAVLGALSVLTLSSELGIFKNLRTQRIEMLSTNHLEVISPDGFGPDNLRYWFGLKGGVVDGNGNIAYNSLSKTNAIEWKNMTSGNINGSGTPVDGGVVLNNLGMATTYSTGVTSYYGQQAEENARIAFGVDGTFTILSFGGSVSGSPVSGPFVTTPSPSTGFLYEVRFEQISGDALGGTLGTWLAISSTRDVSLSVLRTVTGVSLKSAVVTITVRKIGNAATEKAVTVTLNAAATVVDGTPP